MWQHFSVPVSELDESSFEEGFGFDGSSIRGWQPIHASDMLIIPDPKIRGHGSVHEGFRRSPSSATSWTRSPKSPTRAIRATSRRRRRAYLHIHGPRGHRVLRAGGGVLHLRPHRASIRRRTPASTASIPTKGAGTRGRDESQNLGYKPRYKEGYFPVSPDRQPAGPAHARW